MCSNKKHQAFPDTPLNRDAWLLPGVLRLSISSWKVNGRHDRITERCAVRFLIPPVVNIRHFEQGVKIWVWYGWRRHKQSFQGGGVTEILIDITCLSVIVLELLTIKQPALIFPLLYLQVVIATWSAGARYLPSRLLLMAFKVVTCEVLTFITIIFEVRRGSKGPPRYQEATSLWIIVCGPR